MCIGCSRGCDGSNKTLPTGWSSRPLVACHPSLPSPCVRNRLLMVGKPVAPTGGNNERTELWMKGSTIDCGFNLLGYARIYG